MVLSVSSTIGFPVGIRLRENVVKEISSIPLRGETIYSPSVVPKSSILVFGFGPGVLASNSLEGDKLHSSSALFFPRPR